MVLELILVVVGWCWCWCSPAAQLDRQRLATRREEREELVSAGGRDPWVTVRCGAGDGAGTGVSADAGAGAGAGAYEGDSLVCKRFNLHPFNMISLNVVLCCGCGDEVDGVQQPPGGPAPARVGSSRRLSG